MAISAEEVLSQSTAYATSAYNATMQQRSAQLSSMANSANQLYIQAANQAAAQAGTVGREQALRQALTDLAGKGISISTYVRKDGVTVTTPVDVGVRRMVNDQLRQRGIQQVTELAKELDRNYVEVSITANCRESHAEWQGQIYSLEPDDETYPYFYDACNYGDPVDGIGGYNCGHEVHIYRPEIGSTFTDPLEGTGYTTEEVRELTATQRALENNIRKTKRQVSTLKAAGYDTTALSAKLRNYKQQLSELLSTHSAVLRDVGSYRTGVNRAQLSINTTEQSILGLLKGLSVKTSSEKSLRLNGIEYKRVTELKHALTDEQIISKVGGVDLTKGSCSSLSWAYSANKAGLNVSDFRGGASRFWWSLQNNIEKAAADVGATVYKEYGNGHLEAWNKLQQYVQEGKTYILGGCGHSAVIKKEGDLYYYLELQQDSSGNGWQELNRGSLKSRFGAILKSKYIKMMRLIDLNTADKDDLKRLMGYINTNKK